MKKRTATFLTMAVAASALMAFAQAPAAPVQQGGRGGAEQPTPPGPNANSQYRLGPDSMPQEGVPKGSRDNHRARRRDSATESIPGKLDCLPLNLRIPQTREVLVPRASRAVPVH